MKIHKSSLIAICDQNERFLQVFDEQWECWLFPYFHTCENNDTLVASETASRILGVTVSLKYVATEDHEKYSVSHKECKYYRHRLYFGKISRRAGDSEYFSIGNAKYRWMSICQMKQEPSIMLYNGDIVEFVKKTCC